MRGESAPSREFADSLLADGVECLVAADATTSPSTLDAFKEFGARVFVSDAPRGSRLSHAAAAARGDVLLFLHADTLLPKGWPDLVECAVAGGAVGGAFRLAFAGGGVRLSWVAFWANLRTGFTRVPYGDQAPFVRRDLYESLGGHKPWPLLDDYDFSKRLRDAGRIVILPAAVRTSPRRYLERGVMRTILQNWRTLAKFKKGVDPETLAAEYRR